MRRLIDREPGPTAIARSVFIERREECVNKAIHCPGTDESLAVGSAVRRFVWHLGKGYHRFGRCVIDVVEPAFDASLYIVFLNIDWVWSLPVYQEVIENLAFR